MKPVKRKPIVTTGGMGRPAMAFRPIKRLSTISENITYKTPRQLPIRTQPRAVGPCIPQDHTEHHDVSPDSDATNGQMDGGRNVR